MSGFLVLHKDKVKEDNFVQSEIPHIFNILHKNSSSLAFIYPDAHDEEQKNYCRGELNEEAN